MPNDNLPASVAQLKTGDEVRITTKDGQVLEFKVTEVTETRILGGDKEVAVADINKIERREYTSAAKGAKFMFLAYEAVILGAGLYWIVVILL